METLNLVAHCNIWSHYTSLITFSVWSHQISPPVNPMIITGVSGIRIHLFPSLLCSESLGLVPLFFVVYPFKRYESLLRVPLPGAQKVEALKVADSKELWVKRHAAVSQGGQGTDRDWQREEMKSPAHMRTEKGDPLCQCKSFTDISLCLKNKPDSKLVKTSKGWNFT